MEETMDRDWESLPSNVLVQIFKNLDLENRLLGVPWVCRAWNYASKVPSCWESILSLNDSPENILIKLHADDVRHFHYSFAAQQVKAFIERSSGRATTLLLSADESEFEKDTLAFIADRCPHLKHLSLQCFGQEKSEEGLLEVMKKCKELELLSLDEYCFKFSAMTVEEMGRCWPHLRGLRWSGNIDYTQAIAISASFPHLKLLNLSRSTLCNQGLCAILEGCRALQFLDVRDCYHLIIDGDISEKSAHILDFHYDERDEDTELYNNGYLDGYEEPDLYNNDYLDPEEYHSVMRGERDEDEEGDAYWSCCGNPWSGGSECHSCDNGGTMRKIYRDGHFEESHWPFW